MTAAVVVSIFALAGYVSWRLYKASKLRKSKEDQSVEDDTKSSENGSESLVGALEGVDVYHKSIPSDFPPDATQQDVFERQAQIFMKYGRFGRVEDIEVNEEDDEPVEIVETVGDRYVKEHEGEIENMRHDKNSKEAWDQYVAMKIADLLAASYPEDVMRKLYEIPFVSNDRIDENGNMYQEVIDEHEEFFGQGSKWNEKYTMGDVITYWAEKLNWDLGDNNYYDYQWFVEYILDQSNLAAVMLNSKRRNSDDRLYQLVHEIENNTLTEEVDGESYFGMFHVTEEELRRDLPGDLADTQLKDISILRQFWTVETKLMDQIEEDSDHKRENGYINPNHMNEPFDEFDDDFWDE